MSSVTVHQIVKALGREAVQSACGVGYSSIRAAQAEGKFPARWYGPLRNMCDEKSIGLPLSLFSWSEPDKKVGNAATANQGQRAKQHTGEASA